MNHYLIIPGLGNSGPEHWQTYFEQSGEYFIRINQHEWDSPSCQDWVSAIDEVVSSFDLSKVILIGHSLGCTTIAHWAKESGKRVKGAMLVAPSDIENPVYTFPATGFSPIPTDKINFPSIVVASTNDPWVSLERASFFAERWGSRLINIGNAGHINTDAGFGKWEQGLEILHSLD
jgi:uncharacterized protein